jgi:hypothetical protein
MKTIKLRQPPIFILSILMLAMMSCSIPVLFKGSAGAQDPTAEPKKVQSQFKLTIDQAPVKVTHGSTTSDLAKGQTQDIFPQDKIEVGAGGHSQLVYSDRVTVEIMQGAELVIGDVSTGSGGRIEAILLQNKGHLHVTIGDNAKAGVILITQDSQVTTLGDGSVYSVCYKPGTDGLTCVLVEKGSIEVRDKTTGKSQIYPPLVAGYTFNGKAPQPSICIHADEYNNWLSKMRKGVAVETLGAMVGRWNKEPCPG